ncbi:MAG: hypothetical protein HY016_07125 [Nitrosomonadales bacterium]|nr:hypothetical protein [Nitrosomonadales bacterium]
MTASSENRITCRLFISYTGVKLPFRLVNQLEDSGVENRNTFFRGYFDEQDRLTGFEKIAYGEVELTHCYEYHNNGKLKHAEITDIDGEVTVLGFNAESNTG